MTRQQIPQHTPTGDPETPPRPQVTVEHHTIVGIIDAPTSRLYCFENQPGIMVLCPETLRMLRAKPDEAYIGSRLSFATELGGNVVAWAAIGEWQIYPCPHAHGEHAHGSV